MTFILGINLSDRLILAADTKISKLNEEKKRETVGYCVKLHQFSNGEENTNDARFVSCMFAGNKRFAMYLAGELTKAFENKKLPTDIIELKNRIDGFMKKIISLYTGKSVEKKCKMIFAGVSARVKTFDVERLSEIVGDGAGAGKIEDVNIAESMKLGWNNGVGRLVGVPHQSLFSFVISERDGKFGILEEANTFRLIDGGSYILDGEKRKEILKYFLNKREISQEGKDVVNYIRNLYNETIGGAITLGYIDKRGAMVNVEYGIDRSKSKSKTNWSLKIIGNTFLAIDPSGEEFDLAKGWYQDEDDGGLEI